MKLAIRISVVSFLLLAVMPLLAQSAIDRTAAERAFAEFAARCSADNGRLWGHSLCGPMVFVDPQTRNFASKLSGASGTFKEGKLSASENIANTAVSIDGILYPELLWPLPKDSERRAVLLMHESFHRLQREQHLASGDESPNNHLDTVQGRYWLRLELRALSAALRAEGKAREQALRNALAFRAQRNQLFPDHVASEYALETNEGLAEYTGVKLGLPDPARQLAYALQDLAEGEAKPSFVRSFAYATGPAYGLLLDGLNKDWHSPALRPTPMVTLTSAALRGPAADVKDADDAARQYGGPDVWSEEEAREHATKKRNAEYRAHLVEGPVLKIPLEKMDIEFNPNQLFPLGDLGTVYPSLRISDVWGVLEVSKGAALVAPQWNLVTVEAPAEKSLQGDGWKLHLNEGYELKPGDRPGDWIVGKGTSK